MEVSIYQHKMAYNYILFSFELPTQKRTIIYNGRPYFVSVPKLSFLCLIDYSCSKLGFAPCALYIIDPYGYIPYFPNILEITAHVCLGNAGLGFCKSPFKAAYSLINKFWDSNFSDFFINDTFKGMFLENLNKNIIGTSTTTAIDPRMYYSKITEDELNEYVKSACR